MKTLLTLSRPRILKKFQPLFGVADSDSLSPEPDPAFQVNPDPDLGFYEQKFKKNRAEFFFLL